MECVQMMTEVHNCLNTLVLARMNWFKNANFEWFSIDITNNQSTYLGMCVPGWNNHAQSIQSYSHWCTTEYFQVFLMSKNTKASENTLLGQLFKMNPNFTLLVPRDIFNLTMHMHHCASDVQGPQSNTGQKPVRKNTSKVFLFVYGPHWVNAVPVALDLG